MGYIRHDVIICTSWDNKSIELARDKAVELFTEPMISSITIGINGYRTFMVGPDGSKESWPASDEHDKLRIEFCSWLDEEYRNSLYIDWISVSMAGDEREDNMVIAYAQKEEE